MDEREGKYKELLREKGSELEKILERKRQKQIVEEKRKNAVLNKVAKSDITSVGTHKMFVEDF